MMPDIIPYTEKEALRLGEVLAKAGIPSIGPATCMSLLRVKDGVEALRKRKDITPETSQLLNNFKSRIMDICTVMAGMQGEIISQLEKEIR